jgi:hypothetical protein
MASIYNTGEERSFYSASRYPTSNADAVAMGLSGSKNEEMRAMTIAALRIALNNTELNQAEMDKQLLVFLLAGSTTAINHWKKSGRLLDTENGIRLMEDGVEECARSLGGETRGYNTSEAKVHEWTLRMLNGDDVATNSRIFQV